MAYDNTNTGILMRNERKESDAHPEYTGSINVDGHEYWLSAWVKEGKASSKMAGKKFFSLALRQKEERTRPKSLGNFVPSDDDDDIPF